MIASVSCRRCGSYRMYLECDSLHQTVMIVCELKCFLISQIVITYRHLCNLAMFFTHNMQYSLLLLIHVQVQCDLAITRNICVNVCSLNYLNLLLKYKIGQTCCVCVCVCVCFGSMCLTFFFLRDDFESLKCCLDLWLYSMLDYIHVCGFFFLEKLFLSNLDSQSIYRALLASFYRILNSYSIHQGRYWMLDRCLIASQSIEPLLLWTPLDRSSIALQQLVLAF